jgi:hypothetical protein
MINSKGGGAVCDEVQKELHHAVHRTLAVQPND